MDKFLENIEKHKVAIIIIAAILAVFAFIGNSGNDSSSSSSTTMTDTITPDAVDKQNSRDLVVSESGYLRDIRSVGNSVINGGSDSTLLDLGYEACNALDSGATVSSMAVSLGSDYANDPVMREASFAVIAASVINLCPEYKYQAESLGN